MGSPGIEQSNAVRTGTTSTAPAASSSKSPVSSPEETAQAIETSMGKPVEKATSEEIQKAWIDVYGDTSLTADQADGLDTKILDAVAPKPTWMTKSDQQLSPQDRVIIQQFQNVLGREVDPAGLAHYRAQDMTPEEMAKDLATSDEAAQMGVDPAKYGAVAVDPSTLTGTTKQYYDVWKKYNPGTTLTDAQVARFSWANDTGTLAAYEAQQAGEITNAGQYDASTGAVYSYKVVSPAAIDRMGGEIQLRGNSRNEIVIAPEGAQWAWGHENWQKTGSRDGMGIYVAKGNPTSSGFSLVGNVLGSDAEKLVDNIIPNEQKFFMDPLGVGGSMIYGKSFNSDATKSVAKDFGLKPEDVQLAQHIGRSVVEGALLMAAGPLAVPLVGAVEFSSATNTAAQGNVKFGRAMASAAITTASAAASAYLSPPFAIAANAGIRSISGQNSEQIFDGMLWDIAGVVVPGSLSTLARPLVDKDVKWEDAITSYAIQAGTSAAATGGEQGPWSELAAPWESTKAGASSLFTTNPLNEQGQAMRDRLFPPAPPFDESQIIELRPPGEARLPYDQFDAVMQGL